MTIQLHIRNPATLAYKALGASPLGTDKQGAVLLGLRLANPLAIAEGSVQDVNLGDTYSYFMIQGLQPGTEYIVSVNPIFGAIEGPIITAKATTCK